MLGAIVGDIVGSIYEFNNHKSKDFDLFGPGCTFTDDTVLTVAVADWLTSDANLVERLTHWSYAYPNCSYGGLYWRWLNSRDRKPYNSYGNGSAMRVSPCGWIGAGSLECAKISAEVTHNHPEGIKGAQAVVMAIIVARRGGDRGLIYSKVRYHYKYDLSESVDSIREWYKFDETCQGTAPQAICCALQAVDFEDAIRNAISIGGDSDTVAAITGSIAEAMFGIPEGIREKAISYLPDAMVEVVDRFVEHVRAERGFIYV